MIRIARPLLASAFVALVASLGASCSSHEKSGTPGAIERGPYLQAVTSTSVTVCWRTAGAAPSAVAFGPSFEQVVGEPDASTADHRVTISGLRPGESETYRVLGSQAGGRFTTAPRDGAPFRALVFGDSGDGSSEQLAIADRMARENVDLVLHTGDIVYPDGADEDFGPYFFDPYRELLRSHCIFPAVGNHDLRHSTDGKGEGYRRAFATFANNPQGSPFYYSFEWGDAKFISIESDRLFKQAGPHLAWLEQELASNTRRWLVLYMHVPLFSCGNHGDSPELQATLEPLIERYRVDLVLAGHDHLYERAGPIKRLSQSPGWRGWTSIVTGGGGRGLYPVGKTHPTTQKAESAYHYVVLDFETDAVHGKAVRIDGSVLDDFTLPHP